MNKRNTQKVLRVVGAAISTLRSSKNWTQFTEARDASNGYSVPGAPEACKFCVTGALRHFTRVQSSASDPASVISFIEESAIRELEAGLQSVSHRREDAITVNDNSRNAHARVLRGLRVARTRLRNRLAA